jgi:hypothetical protein
VGTDLFFNQATYDIFVSDKEHPTKEDFLQRLEDLDYGLHGVPYLDSEDVSRAVLYLVTDRGLVTGQVMEIGLGASASGLS